MTNKPEILGYCAKRDREPWERSNTYYLSPNPDKNYTVPVISLSDYEKLAQYYKNGIDCFANPCEEHSGEKTPPFAEFFEKYGGQCLICVVDNNKALQAESLEMAQVLAECRDNDRQAMSYLNQIREIVGGDDFPDMVQRCKQLRKDAEFGRAVLTKREPGKKYGCHCDLEEGMEPDGCVIDSGERHNCFYAKKISVKEQCEYWRVIASDVSTQKEDL